MFSLKQYYEVKLVVDCRDDECIMQSLAVFHQMCPPTLVLSRIYHSDLKKCTWQINTRELEQNPEELKCPEEQMIEEPEPVWFSPDGLESIQRTSTEAYI